MSRFIEVRLLAVVFYLLMFVMPLIITGVGTYVAMEGMEDLNLLLADSPGLADAIVMVSGGFTVALFGLVACLLFTMALRLPNKVDGIDEGVKDAKDIED